jgi:hypothetical protein
MLTARVRVLKVVGDGRRQAVVMQDLQTRAVLKCNVAAGSSGFAAALAEKQKSNSMHKRDQIVRLKVLSCTPPEITVELEKDTEAEVAARAVLRRAVLEAGCAELRHKFVAQAITEGSIGGDILPLI